MKNFLLAAAVFGAGTIVAFVIFHSPPIAQALANPASTYCIQLGGSETTYTAADGSQDGYCRLPGGTSCNSWDLYRGGCPGFPPASSGSLYDINGRLLREGDLISAATFGDPDIYIIHFKPHGELVGYKRLFLNPAIFRFYGHLGGFENVRPVTTITRDLFDTSGLFRNCETNDQKVWATEVTGEDEGILHHVQMTGDQALNEDIRFFDRVFCINTNEDNFYARSITPYYRLADVPQYRRRALACAPEGHAPYSPSIGPNDQTYNGLCCAGLSEVRYPNPDGMVGTSPTRCVRPGCYYQQVQCIQAPCPPILVCPTPTPTPTPVGLSCGQVCAVDADCASGLTCYQPPFYCPSGQYCAQVMPAKVCRLASNPTNAECR